MSDQFDPTVPAPEHAPGPVTWTAAPDVLPEEPGEERAPRESGPGAWMVAGVLGVVLAVLVAGVVVVLRFLSGGGTQPEQVLPSTAVAYAKLDLDPAAGQKLDAVRFLRKFPQAKDKVGEGKDLREVFFDLAASDGGLKGVNYDRDVKPWLGQRIAVAVLPPASGASAPEPVVALAVTDQDKARKGLERLADAVAGDGGSKPGFVFRDGFALIAETEAKARAAAQAAEKAPLSSSANFSADMRALGEDGIASAWVDMGALQKAVGDAAAGDFGMVPFGPLGGVGAYAGFGGLPGVGRAAYAVRFAGADVLEVVGTETGSKLMPSPKQPTAGIADLPDSTVAAFGAAGLDGMVDPLWDWFRTIADAEGAGGGSGESEFDASVRQFEEQYGIALPADLKVLLGHDLVVALDQQGLADMDFAVGLRSWTDPAKGYAVASKLAAALRDGGMPVPVVTAKTADGYALATSPAQLSRMQQKGDLGSREDFRKALPDLDKAHVALWVDIDRLDQELGGDGEIDATMKVLDSVGVTAARDGDRTSVRMRLVTH